MGTWYVLLLLLGSGFFASYLDRKNGITIDDSGRGCSQNKQKYLFFLCVIMYLLIALRDYSVGRDTYGYVKSFELLNVSNGIMFYDRDPAFAILNYVLRHLTGNGHIYLLLVSWPLPISFYLLLKDEKCSCFFVYVSFIVLMILEIFSFSMAGIRQTIAIFFTVVAYKCLNRDKVILCLFAIAIGTMFHLSSVLFLIVILLGKKKFGLIHIVLLAVVFYIVSTNPAAVLEFVTDSALGEQYWAYGTVYKSDASYTMLMIQCAMLCFLLLDHRVLKEETSNRMLLNCAWLGLIASVCTPIIAEFFRVSFYFSFYLCLLVPRIIFRMGKRNRRICWIVFWACSILYMIVFNNPLGSYNFFW